MSVGLGAPEKRLRVFRPSDRDPHVRPAVAAVLRSNPAAVSPRDQLHDRESEPASATTARVERAAEAVEGVSDELRREPGPLVLYVQLDELATRSRGETLTPPAHDPATNVTGNDPVVTGKIALAHLKEFPDYYTRLERMEEQAKREHGAA
jgi:Protein of unknown function (DUF5661)